MKSNRYAAYDDYGLHHLAAHLYAGRSVTARRQALYALISAPFMREKQRRTSSHRSFLRDVTLALEVADEEFPPNVVQEVRLALLSATLGGLATVVPPELVGVLACAGRVEQALGLADLMQDAMQRCLAYLAIAKALIGSGDSARAAEVLERALAATRGTWRDPVEEAHRRLESMAWSSGYDVDAHVDVMAEDMKRVWPQSAAVADIARAMARADAFDRAVEMARAVEDPLSRTEACAEVVETLIQEGELERAMALRESGEEWWQPHLSVELAGLWSREGAIDRALALARAIEDRWYQGKAVHRVVQGLLEKNEIERAQQVAETLESEDVYGLALTDVAQAWARRGRPELALDLVDRAMSAEENVGMLSQAALVLTEIGKTQDLIAVTARATQAVHRMWGWESKCSALKEIGTALAYVAMEAEAYEVFRILEQLEDERQVAWTLGWLADALAQMDRHHLAREMARKALVRAQGHRLREVVKALGPALDRAQALELIDTIKHETSQTEAMIGFAVGWSRVGAHDLAISMAEDVLVRLESPKKDYRRDQALTAIAATLARFGKAEQAQNLVDALASDRERIPALKTVVEGLAGAHSFDQALVVADDIDQPVERAESIAYIVGEMTCGDESECAHSVVRVALRQAEEIEYEPARALAMVPVVKAMARVEDPNTEATAQRALLLATTIDHKSTRADQIGQLAQALVQTGAYEAALDAVELIDDGLDRDLQYVGLVEALGKTGQFDLALGTIERIERDQERSLALAHLAAELSQVEGSEAARSITLQAIEVLTASESSFDLERDVRNIAQALGQTDQIGCAIEPLLHVTEECLFPEDRAEALTYIAAALAEAGDREQAAIVARRAFSITPTEYHIYGRYDAPASIARKKRKDTMCKVAYALARVGDVERATEAVGLMEKAEYRDEVLRQVVKGLAQAGMIDLALEEAEGIEDATKHVSALCDAACALNPAEKTQEALSVWRKALRVASSAGRAEVFYVIEEGAALLGALDQGKILWRISGEIVEIEKWWEG